MACLEAIQIVSISELTLLFTLSNSDLKWLKYEEIAISNSKKPKTLSFILSVIHSSQIFPSCDWLRRQFLAGVLASQ